VLVRLAFNPAACFDILQEDSKKGALVLNPGKLRFPVSAASALGVVVVLLAGLLGAAGAHAQGATATSRWTSGGPDGGDARALAAVPAEPEHLYLGSTTSWLYESQDEGASWHRLAKLDNTNRLILDNILVDANDPKIIFVAAWRGEYTDGGLWVSHDGGKTFAENKQMKGQSIRSFTAAPSNPNLLFAGTLEGVFRSSDRGETWTLISPKGSEEIHEVESLAVDPRNPGILYAGTWHLPWKTTDGGEHWVNMKQGIIEDSDVFSIIVDPAKSHVVYLSACSGIYKSETAGKLFKKVQGIPADARRTRVLMQDPSHTETVFAGTTQGLYKTVDGGHTFKAMTDDNVIVNDVYVDPRDNGRVLLATDRGGVQSSIDGGKTFTPSNKGVVSRNVQALVVDQKNPAMLFAGVINDKEFGGAFRSTDGGQSWQQFSNGLNGRDVYALAETAAGELVAGTTHGVMLYDAEKKLWAERNLIANTMMKMSTATVRGTHVNTEKQVAAPTIQLESRVNALDVSGPVWVAASNYGLLTSRDQGGSWQGGPVMGMGDYLSVAVHGQLMAAARGDRVVISKDAGASWWPVGMPKALTRIHRVVFSADGTLWLGAREGIYFTPDLGKTWLWIERLAFRDVDDLFYDAARNRILASSRLTDEIYSIDPKTMTWEYQRTGYTVALVRVAEDKLVVASTDDGVVIPPSATPAVGPTAPTPAVGPTAPRD